MLAQQEFQGREEVDPNTSFERGLAILLVDEVNQGLDGLVELITFFDAVLVIEGDFNGLVWLAESLECSLVHNNRYNNSLFYVFGGVGVIWRGRGERGREGAKLGI